MQFASRAKLVKTNATVNEILDESAKIKRLTKELNDLKEKQAVEGLTDGDRARLEAEREELLSRLESLEHEKDEQKVCSAPCLVNYVVRYVQYRRIWRD